MPTTYKRAEADAVERMMRQVRAHHAGLRDAEVKVDLVFAHAKKDAAGEPMGPALKHGGYTVAGYARILGLKDRAMGRGDAEIVVDGDRWEEWPDEQKDALLDHELNHFELVAKGVVIKRDDLDRPRLRIRLHDYNFGWFRCIAERHGGDSFEVQQAEQIFTEAGQILFPFAAGVSKVERAESFLASKDKQAAMPNGDRLPRGPRMLSISKKLAGKQPSA